jgi:hypothetical protein
MHSTPSSSTWRTRPACEADLYCRRRLPDRLAAGQPGYVRHDQKSQPVQVQQLGAAVRFRVVGGAGHQADGAQGPVVERRIADAATVAVGGRSG